MPCLALLALFGDLGVFWRFTLGLGLRSCDVSTATDAGVHEADILVIALGADYAVSTTPGIRLGENEFYSVPGATRMRDVVPSFTNDYDLFVIGAGSGGVRAARVAARHGARVAIAEEHRVGGTCAIRGCIPKKLLVYGAAFAEELRAARRYGWDIGSATFDWPALREHVLAEVARLELIYSDTLADLKVVVCSERAVLTSAHGVRLASGREISAGKIA